MTLMHKFQTYSILNDTPFNNGRTAFLAEMDELCNPYMGLHCRLIDAVQWHRGWCLEREDRKDATRVALV
jgi:hypothetical protein